VCSNEGDCPSPRGGNSERVKIHVVHSEGNSRLLIKGSGPLQSGDNHKNVKMGRGHLKTFFFRALKPEKLNFT
jgi:hypothetical protein